VALVLENGAEDIVEKTPSTADLVRTVSMSGPEMAGRRTGNSKSDKRVNGVPILHAPHSPAPTRTLPFGNP
jgi:hypothetical protein